MRYRVYFQMPAYAYVTVDAETKELAVEQALINADEEELDWEIDWDATPELAFVLDPVVLPEIDE